jgi:hypothetical protein
MKKKLAPFLLVNAIIAGMAGMAFGSSIKFSSGNSNFLDLFWK